MPQALIPVFTALGASATTAATLSALTFRLGATLALNAISKALAPKAPKGAGRGIEVNFNDSTAAQRIVVGQTKVGGANMIPFITTGSKGRYGHYIVALAGHECEDITDVYFDQDVISDASISAVTGTANDGLVTSGKYANRAWIRRYLGTATQTRDFILGQADPVAFTSDFRGRGIAYTATQLLFDTKVYAFAPVPTYIVKGAKAYDPRLDSTNGGSGAHRYTDVTTWAWTTNPALLTAWFLMQDVGGDYDPVDEIDWALVAAAANVCDENVSVPPSTTQKRYTCNGVLIATEDFEQNLQGFIDSMLGRITWSGGKWKMYAGAWTTPTETIDRTDILGPIAFQTVQRRSEGRWNGARCTYVSPDRNYQRVECYPRASASYFAADGSERIWIEMEQPLCNNEYEAQRKAEIVLRQSRNNVRLSLKLGPKWQKLSLWETVYLDWPAVGYNDKTFRVMTYGLNDDGTVDVTLGEELAADWADPAVGEYNQPSIATFTTAIPMPDEPDSIATRSVFNGIEVTLTQITSSSLLPNQLYEIWEAPNSQYVDADYSLAWQGVGERVTFTKDTTTPFYYRTRAIIPGGAVSSWTPGSGGVAGQALPSPAGAVFAVTGVVTSPTAVTSAANRTRYANAQVANYANINSIGYRWQIMSLAVSTLTYPTVLTNTTAKVAQVAVSSLVADGAPQVAYLRVFASDTTPTSVTYDTGVSFQRLSFS